MIQKNFSFRQFHFCVFKKVHMDKINIANNLTFNFKFIPFEFSSFINDQQHLIIRNNIICEFWTHFSKQISNNLWLPLNLHNIDWLDLDFNSSKIFSIGLIPNLFPIKIPTINNPNNNNNLSKILFHSSNSKDQEQLNINEDNQDIFDKLKQIDIFKIPNILFESMNDNEFLEAILNEIKKKMMDEVIDNNNPINVFKVISFNKNIKWSPDFLINDKNNTNHNMMRNYSNKNDLDLHSCIYNDYDSSKEILNELNKIKLNQKDDDFLGKLFFSDYKEIKMDKLSLDLLQMKDSHIYHNIISEKITKKGFEMIKKLEFSIDLSQMIKKNTYLNNINEKILKEGCHLINKFDLIFENPNSKSLINIKKKIKKKKVNLLTRRIRIYPSEEQKIYFKHCFGTSRFIYNKGIEYANKLIDERKNKIIQNVKNGCIYLNDNNNQCCKIFDENDKYFCSEHSNEETRWYSYNTIDLRLQTLRKKIMKNDQELTYEEAWQKDIPYDTRQLILKDIKDAYNSAITNKKKGNIDSFRLGFKKLKDPTQIFHIDKGAIDHNLFIFKKRKKGKLRTRQKMTKWIKRNIKKIESNCKIIKYKGDSYYLLLTVPSTTKKDKDSIPFDIATMDPGTETFQTIYSPNGIIIEVGKKFAEEQIMPIEKRIDKLKSVVDNIKNNTIKYKRGRYEYEYKTSKQKTKTIMHILKRESLLRNKIKNKINDLHWKTVKILTENFKTIVTTHFEVKEMVNKENRNIERKTVREMNGLSHYEFKKKLKDKASRRGNQIIIMNESYTSKTCGRCGEMNEPSKDRIYRCKKCKMEVGRYINGARNILIRLITEEGEKKL